MKHLVLLLSALPAFAQVGPEITSIAGAGSDGRKRKFRSSDWRAISGWKANLVRIPFNEDSELGLTCTDIDGFTRQLQNIFGHKGTLTDG